MVAALRCVRPQIQWYQLAYATEIKSIQLHGSIVGLSQKDSILIHTYIHTYIQTSPHPSHLTRLHPHAVRRKVIIINNCRLVPYLTLSGRLGHIWPTRIDLWTGPISLRGRRCPAGLHTADTLWHACINFLTYLDYHPSRLSGLCPSGEWSRSTKQGNMRIYRSFPAVLKWLQSGKGYGNFLESAGKYESTQ